MNGLNKSLYRRRIPETYVQLLFEYLEKLGHDPEKVLGEQWPKAGSNHLEGVDIDHWESLLVIAKDYLNDPLIGLHVGQTITAQHLGILGSVFLACENLGAVLERFERYQRLVYDVVPASVHIYPEYVELSWDTKGEQVGPLSDETGRTVIVQFCRSLIRGKERLKEIHFIHERPENVQPYEEYFGCPVLFEQPVALMRFDKDMLSLPLKNSDAALVAILEKHADKLLASLPHSDEITDQVRRQIAYLLHQGEPTIEQLAERLNYSRRTLQRRLTEAGTNFRKELNTVRYELAKSYLKDLRLQIVEIALLLGYAEHSPFTRAYKEWSGKTPQQAREEMNELR
ncbi:AraC family transcriptional regulator [Acinetobacter baumannii]